MSSLQIPCPKCGSVLRLKDESLLGKRGKCPKCEHRFVLEEPEEVELELATDRPAPGKAAVVGTGAQWVPDHAPAPAFAPEEPPIPNIGVSAGTEGREKLNALNKRRSRQRKMQMVGGALLALAVAGAIFGVRHMMATGSNGGKGKDPNVVEKRQGPTPSAFKEAEKKETSANFASNTEVSPTQGEHIKLRYMPAGTRVIVHLRPAQLWADQQHLTEFRYGLGPLATWLETKIKELTFHEPKQIEELLLCIILTSRDLPPEYCGRVKLVQPAKKSDLLVQFSGTPKYDWGQPVYVGEKYAYIIDREDVVEGNPRTFAFAPSLTAQEMVEAENDAFIGTTQGIHQLLLESDRDRHFTIVCEPKDLQIYREMLVGENLQPLMMQLIQFLGDDVETVAWSFHLGDPAQDQPFFSEVLMKNNTALQQNPLQLRRTIMSRLDKLPAQVLDAVQKMEPQTVGRQKLIGRFPAMVQAYVLNTIDGIEKDHSYLQLTTLLQERAGPNLAVASLLAWDQSTMTDFSKSAPTPTGPDVPLANLPENVIDRLNMPIEIEFSRTPLQEAFAYIADETKVTIEIDGDALKFAGYTKNMPQTMSLGKVPAIQGIKAILAQYGEMVISIDEPKKTVYVLTKKFADDKGLTPYSFGP